MKQLLEKIRQSGIFIRAENGQLKLSVPPDQDFTTIINEIKANKAGLLEFISSMQDVQEIHGPQLPSGQADYELFHQQRKEYLRFLMLGSYAFNMNLMCPFRKIDRHAFKKTMQSLFDRHEALRTTFVRRGEKFYQEVHPCFPVDGIIEEMDICEHPGKEERANEIYMLSSGYPFDFERELMVEIRLVKVLHDTHLLLMTIHHIICDDASVKLMKEEIETLYAAFAAGGENPLQPITWQYKDYSAWMNGILRSKKAEKARAYYHEKITASIKKEYGIASLPLPGVSYREELLEEVKKIKGDDWAGIREELAGSIVRLLPPPGSAYNTYISRSLYEELLKVSSFYKTSLNMLLTAAFAIMMSREGDCEQIRFYVPRSARMYSEFEGIVGWLTSEIIACIDLEISPELPLLLAQVDKVFFEASENSFYPHEALLSELDIPLSVLTPCLLNFIPVKADVLHDTAPEHFSHGSGHFNFRCELFEFSNGIKLSVNYCTGVYTAADTERMMNTLLEILGGFVSESTLAVAGCSQAL
jgi:hypothetical protein